MKSIFIVLICAFLSKIALAQGPSAVTKGFDVRQKPVLKGLNYECFGPTQSPVRENGYSTRFGPVTFNFHCVNSDPEEIELTWRFYYDGVPSGQNAQSFTVTPEAAGYNDRLEFEFQACNSTGCGGGRNPIEIFFAKEASFSAEAIGTGCRYVSEHGWDSRLEKDFNIIAPDPDGDEPSTVEFEPEVISAPPDGLADFVNLRTLRMDTAGSYGVKIRAMNAYRHGNDYWGIYSPDQEINFSCNIERSFSVENESVKLAQSTFLEGNSVDLIQGKPVMARVVLQGDAAWTTGEGVNIPVKATLSTSSGSHHLGGCFKPEQMDASNKVSVNLLPLRTQTPGVVDLEGTGTLSISINPNDGFAVPPGAGCGDLDYNYSAPVPWLTKGLPQQVPNFAFKMVPSPQLSLAFWNVTPNCPLNSCDFNSEDDIQPFVQSSSDLLKAMYPVSSDSVQVHSISSWTVQSAGFGIAGLGKVREVCEGYERGTGCYHSWASEIDLIRVKAAGLMADKGQVFVNRKYIGVVPKAGAFSKSYFGALHARFPEAGRPFLAGVTNFSSRTGDVVLVQSDFPMGLPHEIVHSFDIKFNHGDPTEAVPIHQAPNVFTNGFNFLDLSNGYKENAFSMMRKAPPHSAWIDLETYKKLYKRLWGLPQNKAIEGEELFINGAINKNGEFVTAGAYLGLKAGQSDGDSANILQIYAYDPSGAVVSQSSIPYEYGLIAESAVEEYPIDTSFAPVSTGIPYNENVFRLSLAPVGRMQSSVKTVFPSVEILRTSIDNIPNGAFIGDPADARNRLMGVADKIETALSRSEIISAIRYMKNELAPMAISALKENFARGSILDVGRQELSLSIGEVSARLEAFSGDFPVYQNELLRAVASRALLEGQGAFINVKTIRSPEKSDFEYFVTATLDGDSLKVDEKKRGLAWRIQTPPLSAGQHQVTLSLFMQDARLAKALEDSIDKNSHEVFLLKKQLEETRDPSLREELLKRIEGLERQIQDSKRKLQDGRMSIGTPLDVPLSVH